MFRSRLWQSLPKLAKCPSGCLALNQQEQRNAVVTNPIRGLVNYFSSMQQKSNQFKRSARNKLSRSMLTGASRYDDSLPNLIYFQYPWKYIQARLGLLRLKYFWDKTFREEDFRKGSKQAAVVMANLIRNKDLSTIQTLTTPSGFKQIARDIVLSRQDPRLQLLKFRSMDIKRTIPIRLYFVERNGCKHCIIDMFFVGMRNVNDFDPTERVEIEKSIEKFDEMGRPQGPAYLDYGYKESFEREQRRIVFAEIFTRFHRQYGRSKPDDWTVGFYKVATFDVLTL